MITCKKVALTPRQRQVITLLAEGWRRGKIAEQLGISVKTVARHRENIMARLDLRSRAELVKYARGWSRSSSGPPQFPPWGDDGV